MIAIQIKNIFYMSMKKDLCPFSKKKAFLSRHLFERVIQSFLFRPCVRGAFSSEIERNIFRAIKKDAWARWPRHLSWLEISLLRSSWCPHAVPCCVLCRPDILRPRLRSSFLRRMSPCKYGGMPGRRGWRWQQWLSKRQCSMKSPFLK